jgi:DeoR/GlpR family transcriptional regulator of sugar metabolism
MVSAMRHIKIISLLEEGDLLTVNELAAKFDVSHMTVRRDIKKLENEGIITRSGGAVRISKQPTSAKSSTSSEILVEPSRDEKSGRQLTEKRNIAFNAIQEIDDGMTIYLDAGTTVYELAKVLVSNSNFDDLTVISNDLDIVLLLLKNSEYRIYHTGGLVDRKNQSCVGSHAAQSLMTFQINKAFVSTSSWNSHGIFTPSEGKLTLKKEIFRVSSECFLLSDATKFNKTSTFKIGELTLFSKIFTDMNMSKESIVELEQMGVVVVQ